MKGILKFNLPEERSEFETAVHAGEWKSICWDLNEIFRKYLKYGHSFKTADEAIEKIREDFFELLRDRNLDLCD